MYMFLVIIPCCVVCSNLGLLQVVGAHIGLPNNGSAIVGQEKWEVCKNVRICIRLPYFCGVCVCAVRAVGFAVHPVLEHS